MQGHHVYQEQTVIPINLRQMVPDDHVLVKIDKAVDLSFIYGLTKSYYCPNNGRPSIDPVLFFRMQIIGYLYGIASDRQLCEDIHLNIAYRWFCRLQLNEAVPDHSSLTRIRNRIGVAGYQAIFESLIEQWQAAGIIKGQGMLSDASLIEANAAMSSLVERAESDPQAKLLTTYNQRYYDFKTGRKTRKVANQTHVSHTDPDTSLVSRKSHYHKLCYKTHYSMDGASRMITDCYVTTGAKHECTVFPERVSYQLERFHFPATEWIADKGYGRGPTYHFLHAQHIRAYIPLHDDNLGEGKLSRGEFVYDRPRDRYQCPAGHYLYPYDKVDGHSTKRYRLVGGHCQRCSLRETCLPDNYKQRARFIYRGLYQDEIDKIKKRQKTKHFKKKLKERLWKIEGLFAEAKQYHGLGRAKYRGLANMQIQCYLTALVQNIKRLLSLLFVLLSYCYWLHNSHSNKKASLSSCLQPILS